MNLQQLLIIFWARKGLIIAYLLVTMATTLTLSLLMSKQYVADASLVLDQPGVNPITGESNIPIQVITSYMATQTDIINSPTVSLAVVDSLDLKNDKALQIAFQQDKTGGDFRKLQGYFREWIASGLMKKLEVIPSRESSILGIRFSATDPEFAAKAANAYAQAYIQIANELKRQPAQQTADWFEGQLTILRERVEKNRNALSDFQQMHGIVASSNERIDLEDTKLAELSDQLIKSQLQTEELLAKKQQLTKVLVDPESLKSSSEAAKDLVLQELTVDLARSEAKFADIAIHFDKNHPQYRQAAAEMANLKKQVKERTNTVLQGFNNSVLSSIQRDASLIKKVSEQKNNVLQLKKQRDEIAVLMREVENAQKAYDTVIQRSIQMRMESEITQSNIAILDLATVPKIPNSPKIRLNMLISVLLGLILGVGAALIAEIMDRRVRSAIDITDALDLPVFGVITPSSPPKKFSRLFGVRS